MALFDGAVSYLLLCELRIKNEEVKMGPVALKMIKSAFLKEEVMGLSKEELIIKLYDIGIAGCMGKDRDKVSKVFAGLIDSLNFDYGEIPARLFRLYQYAMGEARKGNFGEALNVLQELRETWIKTFKLEEKYKYQEYGEGEEETNKDL